MKAIYYGHSSVWLELEGATVLFDPFISPNPEASHIDIGSLKPDYIVLSHAHEDHVADMAAIQKNSQAKVMAIVETAMWVNRQDIPESAIIPFNFGGTVQTNFGTIKMVYALHTNAAPDGQYAGVPAGYVLKSGNKTIYFAGDTALTLEMKLLEHLGLDWAFLPIGGHFTMDVEDAITACQFINCKHVVGIHYDTFPPITIDKNVAKKKFADAGLDLHLLEIGGELTL
ncbi:metal-dependent hydrolase [Parapedobacter indicus]|uniref:L-ascorbate metabolism protein UlaG, beta-lactamase superfamily n=1 Tax=Parapedobacter indicus TaxID=1477437 RepID=A0A1I3UBT5_9SPHI|nr:metal-dependent hydrolase [Parapedobacter indicus]PPK99231.1 L-ascorbate metabolism protein UlaG (beta-lactamase superfamily) [Parapedobacter indicus]SFJ80365.1 L-ascorbate metabolism protein UlaG, beta-lactamase superfamily [Parapedobacter indicus]